MTNAEKENEIEQKLRYELKKKGYELIHHIPQYNTFEEEYENILKEIEND